MPSFCTRGERRDVESIIVKSLYNLEDKYDGTYYSLKDLTLEEETTLANVIKYFTYRRTLSSRTNF